MSEISNDPNYPHFVFSQQLPRHLVPQPGDNPQRIAELREAAYLHRQRIAQKIIARRNERKDQKARKREARKGFAID